MNRNCAALLAGSCLWVFASTASAQTPTAPARDASASTDDPIVVTGSRLAASGFESPTPVTVLDTSTLTQTAPSNLPDALNQLPVFSGSISQFQARDSQANTVRAGNYLNLRGLGPQRLLLLQDGIRIPSTSNNGGADANLIPQMLVQRVEIVTGGASAAYGSDAVSGVVNFVLDKKFEGVRAIAQRGISGHGDNGSYKLGLAAGVSLLDDRLHILASAEHYHSDGIPARVKRGGPDKQLYANIGNGTAASPIVALNNIRVNNVSYGGLILSGPLTGQQFLPGGGLGPFNPGVTVRSGLGQNGDGVHFGFDEGTLIGTLTTDQFFGRVSYDALPELTFFAQASYAESKTKDHFVVGGLLRGATIFSGNAFLTPAVQTALGATPNFRVGRSFREAGALPAEQGGENLLVVGGVEGKFGDGWSWDAYVSHADSKFRSEAVDLLNRETFAALDAVRSPTGQIVCRITITNPGLMDNCVPINTFGAGSLTPAMIDFIHGVQRWSTTNKTTSVAANISGSPFALWAGDVSVAFGAEYRHQSLKQVSNSNPAIPTDFTGIRGGSGGLFATNNVGVADGSYNVKEAYVEVGVPLLRDSPVGHSLDVNGAYRYTDYSTSGSVHTWKVGLTYEPIEDVRFRGVVSRDIRAPTLFELFSTQTQSIQGGGFFDPLTQQSGLLTVISGGNPNLKPEIGRTWSAGVVVQPSFLSGFAASVDYYKIKITDAIATPFTGTNIVQMCFASGGTSALCSLISRPLGPTNTSPQNFPTSVSITQQNVSRLETEGLDIELSYRRDLGAGKIGIRGLARRLISFKRQESDASAVVDFAGTSDFPGPTGGLPLPKWQGSVDVNYSLGGWTLGVQERFIGKFKRSKLLVYADNDVPSVAYTDANLSYDVPTSVGDAQLFLTVNNVFNKKPPLFVSTSNPGIQIPAARNIHDIVGRYVTVGVKLNY